MLTPADRARLTEVLEGAADAPIVKRQREPITPPGGGAARPPVMALITGWGPDVNADGNPVNWTGKLIDDTGVGVGDELVIQAVSLSPTVGDGQGNEWIERCLPAFHPGDLIRIQPQTNYIRGQMITGWYAVDTLVRMGCGVTEITEQDTRDPSAPLITTPPRELPSDPKPERVIPGDPPPPSAPEDQYVIRSRPDNPPEDDRLGRCEGCP